MNCTKVMSRVVVLALCLTAAGITAVSRAGETTEQGIGGSVSAASQWWDCVRNKTGKTVDVWIVSPFLTYRFFPNVPPDESRKFTVTQESHTVVLIAFERATKTVVAMTAFSTLAQGDPPSNCLPFQQTTMELQSRGHEHAEARESKGGGDL